MVTLDAKKQFYLRCCARRLEDLINWVSRVYPGQTITRDWTFKNAPLHHICKTSNGTQRVIDWCKQNIHS